MSDLETKYARRVHPAAGNAPAGRSHEPGPGRDENPSGDAYGQIEPPSFLRLPDGADASLRRSSRLFGKPEATQFTVYALAESHLSDTAESRRMQRERVREIASVRPENDAHAAFLDGLKRALDCAEKFDLLILDSGNVYWNAKLITPKRVSKDGATLFAENAEGGEIKIPKERPDEVQEDLPEDALTAPDLDHEASVGAKSRAGFSYARDQSSHHAVLIADGGKKRRAAPHEVAASLAGLPELPPDYIDRVLFNAAEAFDAKLPPARDATLDLVEAGEDEIADEKYDLLSLSSYRYVHENGHVTIQIPNAGVKENAAAERAGYYRVKPEDVPLIAKAVLHFLPRAFLPEKLRLVFMPARMKHNTAAVTIEDNTVLFSTCKAKSFSDFFAQCLMASLQHEAAHVFHRDNPEITSLLLRCMALDGWTMNYGDTSATEYFAVLCENFFDNPENRRRFPNGYRLLYALMKLREEGEAWDGEKSGPRLKLLATGGDPFAERAAKTLPADKKKKKSPGNTAPAGTKKALASRLATRETAAGKAPKRSLQTFAGKNLAPSGVTMTAKSLAAFAGPAFPASVCFTRPSPTPFRFVGPSFWK